MKLATPLRTLTAIAVLAVPIAVPVLSATSAQAVESPPNNATFYLQTNGSAANIGLGDWYTAASATAGGQDTGGGGGVHYLSFNVPCSWPAADPVDVDLYSPEINENATVDGTYDEPGGTTNYDTTGYKLFGPNATIGTDYKSETGAQLAAKTYAPADEGTTEAWQRFDEIPAPVACGNYLVQSLDGVGANGNAALEDDQNGWKLRVGDDQLGGTAMVTGLQTPPADYDNPSGTIGDDQQLTIGQVQTSYQGDFTGGGCQNQTFYHYVDPGQASVTFRNFDLDNPAGANDDTATYFDPNGVQHAGTASGSTLWNNSGTTSTDRGTGDVIANPVSGWWRIVICATSHNQYIVEADDGAQIGTIYYPQTYTGATTPGQPPTPNLTVSKTDGQTVVDPGQTLSYTITLDNTATGDTAGAATNIVATDRLPANFTFTSCTINSPLAGTCADVSGSVVATLSKAIDSGAQGTITVTGTVNSGFTAGSTLTNPVSVAYDDSLGQPYPTITASHSDTAASANLSITKTHTGNFEVGTDGTYTVTVTNGGPNRANGVQVVDTLPAGETFVSGAGSGNTNWTCTAGTVAANGTTPVTCLYTGGSFANATSSAITLTVAVGTLAYPSVTNTATVSSSTIDPSGTNNTTTDPTTVIGATIGDTVFDDANDDGIQNDTATAGISGDTVGLLNSSGAQIATTTTSSTGIYGFAGLAGGSYSIKFVAPTGYGFSPTNKGTAATDSNPAPATGITSLFTIANGATDDTIDAGLVPLGSISGESFTDANGNGTPDTGEQLTGQTVTLSGTDDLGNQVSASTVTDGNGAYKFANLRPGSYTVSSAIPTDDARDPAGYGTSPRSVTLSAGQASTAQDFGYISTLGSLSGTVWTDNNANGVLDGTDTALKNVTVTLSNGATTTTDANGNYNFTGLTAGSYTVTVTAPSGAVISKNGASTTLPDSVVDPTLGTDTVTLPSGGSVANIDAGIVTTDTISGVVFADAGSPPNGTPDTGEGLAIVTVTLSGTDDLGKPVSSSMQTGSTGAYSFAGLRPGSYTATETVPTGYSLDPVGSDGVASYNNTVTSGATPVDNFGLAAADGSISGTVWTDANIDGLLDNGESGVASLVVTLSGTDSLGNNVSLTMNTDHSGDYDFTGLVAGNYVVTVTKPTGTFFTKENVPASLPSQPSVVNVDTGSTATIALASGGSQINVDAGLVNQAALSGEVFVDSNGNGTPNTGEQPVAGAVVTLAGTNYLGNAVSVPATTNASGIYAFSGLAPGTYTLTDAAGTTYLNGADSAGTQTSAPTVTDGTAGSPPTNVISDVTLTGGPATDYDFGVRQGSSISGEVYDDVDASGTLSAGDTPIGGVTLTLTGTDDTGTAIAAGDTTMTDVNGDYTFGSLRPGNYTVTETQPTTYGEGSTNVGMVNATTVGSGATDVISQIIVADGQAGTAYDFGEQGGDVDGTVFDDETGSGSPTPNSGLTGLTVTATSAGGTVYTTTTDSHGDYDFPGLPAGNYTVSVTNPPAGFTLVDGTNPASSTVTAGNVAPATDFGYENTSGVISGTVFNDLDGDGLDDNSDTPAGSVTVNLLQNGTQVATTTTGGQGNYKFANLPLGDYVVQVEPGGALFSAEQITGTNGTTDSDVNVTTGKTATLTLSSATPSQTNVDAGLIQPNTIGGTVYFDDNRNGVDNSEPAVDGASVTLTGVNDLGVTITPQTARSDTAGDYSFTGLRPGAYQVVVTVPNGYVAGASTAATPGNGTSASATKITNIALTSGTDAAPEDFGIDAGSLSGEAFFDTDGSGTLTPGDTAITTQITLTPATGPAVSIQSGANGTYSFTDLPAGTYTVTATTPAGDVLDSGQSPDSVVIAAGGVVTGVDFGYRGEAADLGVSVTGPATVVTGTNATYQVNVTNNGPDASVPTITDTLPAGSTLVSSTGTGWNCTQSGQTVTCTGASIPSGGTAPVLTIVVTAGTTTGRVSDIATVSGSLTDPTSSNDSSTANTTVITPADIALSGLVYDDVDGSGTDNVGDRPIANVTVTLTGTDDLNNAVDLTTTSQSDGTYSFTGLRPGTYAVTETQPTAYSEGTTAAGSAGGTVSNANHDAITGVVLANGVNATDYDFGETGVTLSGTIYNDKDGDGLDDNSDSALGGQTVTLTLADGTVLSTTTANDGTYSFTGLPAGKVSIVPSGPSGDVLTQGSNPDSVTLLAGTPKTGVDFGYHAADADVAVAVSGPTTGTAGQDQAYTVTVTNNGPDNSGPLTVTIPIPSGVTVVGTSSPGNAWTCNTTGGLLTCTTTTGIGSGGTAPVLTVTLGTDPTATGTLTVTPTVSGTTADGNTGNNTATTSTTLSAPTILPPVARNDKDTTKSGTPVGISVLGNDTDPQGYALTVSSFSQPAHGTVTCTTTGVCTYTPNKDFVGTDTFTYMISDGHGNSSIATVTVTVTNQPPVAKPDHTSTPEGTPVVTSVLGNDSDPEGQTLTVTKHTQGAHGSVSCTATACTYIPDPGFVGTDTYTYTISDGHGGTSTTTVTVKVTDGAPVAINDSGTTTQGQPVTVPVTSNDTDPNGDPLTVVKHSQPAHGTVSCTAKACTYTPDPGFVGTDTYTYTISDGHGKFSTATVTVTVTGVLGVTTGRQPGGSTTGGSTPPSSTSGGSTPFTGSKTVQELQFGGWLIGLGLLLLLGGRRRRRHRPA